VPKNLFVDLISYPYKPEHNPRENQHTIFFSYLIDEDRCLLKYLLKKLVGSKAIGTLHESDFEVVCFPKEYIGNKLLRPDIKISTSNKKLTVYIENKIDSPEGKSGEPDHESPTQLGKYLKLAESAVSDESFLLYMTKYYEDINANIFKHRLFGGQFIWGMVSDWISEYSRASKKSLKHKELIGQFLDYMEVSGLTGSKKFEKEYAQVWMQYNEFDKTAKEYLDYIARYFKNLDYVVGKDNSDWYTHRIFTKKGWNRNRFDGFWINIGFNLESEEPEPFTTLSCELGINRRLYDNIEREAASELRRGLSGLEKLDFYVWNDSPVLVTRDVELSKITHKYSLVKSKQIEAVLEWTSSALKDLEHSSLLRLLQAKRLV
jgi:hypothetical protein